MFLKFSCGPFFHLLVRAARFEKNFTNFHNIVFVFVLVVWLCSCGCAVVFLWLSGCNSAAKIL